jgi:hypothetical protein
MTEGYSIETHAHRFSAWAASRAASQKVCRFSVEKGRLILEASGFDEKFSSPSDLPDIAIIDETHRVWREKVIKIASEMKLNFTHGVAAKIINCYLKSRFVLAGYHEHPKVARLHPPIDKLLLERLSDKNFGNKTAIWKRYNKIGWSKFNSNDYETIIGTIQKCMPDQPLWMIEEYWVGYQ